MKKIKWLTPLIAASAATSLITPILTATSCSCGKDYSKTATLLKDEAIRIFKEVTCSVRHKSYNCGAIFDKYKEFVLNELKDEKEVENKWVTDTYQNDYRDEFGITKGSPQDPFKSAYSNAFFDIPASKGCENWDRIIFQGHIDMVEDGFKDTDTKIDIEETKKDGKNIIHVKDDRTSLGADNGAGIALMLAMLTKRNEFVHGPIRCIFTADEEIGMLGAKYLPANWLDAKYLLNIDGETEGELIKSCAGGYSMNYYAESTDLTEANGFLQALDPNTDYAYKLKITGLKKSHSADVTENMTNAVKLAASFLNYYYSEEYESKLIKFTTPDTDIDATNAVPVTAEAVIAVNKSWDQETCNTVAKEWQDKIRANYSEESNALVTLEAEGQATVGFTQCLKTKQTKAVYECLDKLIFGPISYLDEDKTILESSSNVGPICFDVTLSEEEIKKGYSPLMIKFYSRSCNNNIMTLIKSHNERCLQVLQEAFVYDTTKNAVKSKQLANFPGWAPDEKNEMIDWLVNSYKSLGVKTNVAIIHGGVEPAWWVNKHPGLISTSVGPAINGCHTAGETLYVDTYMNEIKSILYVLDKLAK